MTNLTTKYDTNIIILKKLCSECFPENKILSDLTFVQAILESGIKNAGWPSLLAMKYNNLFGIKGKGIKTGKSVRLSTFEYVDGVKRTVLQDFAWNDSIEESLQQHKILLNKPRYQLVVKASSFHEAAVEIHRAGYATDPLYSELLESVYNKLNLS